MTVIILYYFNIRCRKNLDILINCTTEVVAEKVQFLQFCTDLSKSLLRQFSYMYLKVLITLFQ